MKTLNNVEVTEVYRVLIEKANSIILIWGEDGIINHINDYGAGFFGYRREELIGQPVMILVPEVDTKGKNLTFLAQEIIGHPDQYVIFSNENIKKNNERVWISWTNSVITNEAGRKEVLTIGNDITESRNAEDQLRIERDKLRVILENINAGVVIIEKNGKIVNLNRSAREIHGFESEKEIIRNFPKFEEHFELQFPNGKLIPINDWPFPKALRGEYVQNYHTILIRKRTHTYRFINYSVTPVYERNEDIAYFVINMRDETEAMTLENELKLKNRDLSRLNAELEKFNELLESLLYITAHDIRGPFNNFKLIAEIIPTATTQEMRLKLTEQFKRSYSRLEKIIDGLTDILRLQKIEGSHIRRMELEQCLKGVLMDLKMTDEINKSITWDFNSQSEIHYVETYLTSILRNLISNAVKYRKKDIPLKIHLKSKKKGKFVLITVEDNGIGMDLDKNKKNLFKPFKRFSGQAEGTGIGLYLINNMISQNGGHIDLESTPGKGTTFYCYLVEYPLNIDQLKS